MSQHWLEANASRLKAEILRDFCVVSIDLEQQFIRHDNAGYLSYSVLRELLGDQMDRGILWRLKDTAHHILRDARGCTAADRLLDWAIGYIFHDVFKLMEDTHQQQYYAPSLLSLAGDNPSPELEAIARDFSHMAQENQKAMGGTIQRIRRILAHARLFFQRCYMDQKDNLELARLIHDREEMVTAAFADDYDNLKQAIYGDRPQTLYINAALSLLQGGRFTEAKAAYAKAIHISPDDQRLQEIAEALSEYGTCC